MDALNIHCVHTRYRLRGENPPEMRKRLDSVLREVLEQGLDPALAHLDSGGDEQICVRRVFAPVRLKCGRSAHALMLDWSLALAQAIELALKQPGSEVLRYRSRLQAITDFASGVACAAYGRAWAWRQLGLCKEEELASSPADALVRTLEADAAMVIPVLCALARLGRLPGLAGRLSGGHWVALARAALEVSGAAADVLTAEIALGSQDSAPAANRASRALEHSPLVVLARVPKVAAAGPEVRRAVAALALLAGEPCALRGEAANARLALDQGMRRLFVPDSGSPSAPHERNRSTRTRSADRPVPGGQREPLPQSAARRAAERPVAPDEQQPARASLIGSRSTAADADSATANAEAGQEAAPRRALEPPSPGSGADGAQEPAEPDESPLPDTRCRARTRWGGLLFLLWLMDECGVAEQAMRSPVLAERSLRWVLHRIALALLPLSPEDPAALAFAGLMPDAEPPSLEQPAATPEEQAMVGRFAADIVASLAERLNQSGADRERLLQQVCSRRAEIVTDPGWIEVRLSLEEISTTVRRCGLDLDPGYLPWLGAVVKFVYE